jgi:cation-transporting ATPase E
MRMGMIWRSRQRRHGADGVDAERGLTDREAAEIRARGLGHAIKPDTGRTYRQIVRQNLLTFLNLVLVVIGGVLIGMGLWRDAIMATGLVLINAVVGIVQEVRAKRRLDQIALLTRAKARLIRDGTEREADPTELVQGDLLAVGPGDQILVDGRVVGSGSFDCDESLLTGESDLIPKKRGDEVYSGAFCVNGAGRYVAEKVGAYSLAQTITAGARAYRQALTPLQQTVNLIIRLLLVIAAFYLVMVLVGAAIWRYPPQNTVIAAAVVVGIVPTGLFLMITVTYSMAAVRLANQSALIQQTNAVESLSNVDVFCMDKTGTLTANRLALGEFAPIGGDEPTLRQALGGFAASASATNKTSEAIAAACPEAKRPTVDEIPFSSARKWSALSADVDGLRGTFALGAPELLGPHLRGGDGLTQPDGWTERGLRVLLFARSPEPGPLHDEQGEPRLPASLEPAAWLGFTDELRPNSKETLDGFRQAGITLKIISGDNPETVAALARQAGLPADAKLVSGLELAEMDDAAVALAAREGTVFGRITPEQKEQLVDALRAQGHYVAMTGDGVNDVLSLKRANLGIAMQSGSQATRGAADIVLLHDSFEALPAAFQEGQRIRRGLHGILALFVTRVFVVALIILAVAVVQAGFPFSPSHLAIITVITVGIPTFALALFAHPGAPPERFIASLTRFVLPAAVSLAIAGFATYTSFYFLHDVDLEALRQSGLTADAELPAADQIARDALTYFLVLGGLWLVIFAAPPTAWWAVIEENTGDWRPALVALAMLPLYALTVAVPAARDFFGVHTLSATDYLLIGAMSVAWALALRYVWKYRLFDRYFGYAPAT